MSSNSPFSPVSPQTPYPAFHHDDEGRRSYSTPAHEGLQPVEEPPEQPPQRGPYSYQGQIQPDVVPLSALGDKYNDDHLLPSYPQRRIWGVAARTFWIIVGVVIALIVIVVAVGAGVGGSAAARHAKEANGPATASSSLSSTATSSATGVATSSSSSASATGSPTSPATSSSASSTASSTSSAVVGATPVPATGILPLDCPNIDGSTYSTSTSKESSFVISCSASIDGNDAGRTFAPSIDACIEDCAAYSPTGACIAIVFNANMTLSNPLDGNCYFKNSSSSLHVGSYTLQASAVLQ